jgi:hypothetical protein
MTAQAVLADMTAQAVLADVAAQAPREEAPRADTATNRVTSLLLTSTAKVAEKASAHPTRQSSASSVE